MLSSEMASLKPTRENQMFISSKQENIMISSANGSPKEKTKSDPPSHHGTGKGVPTQDGSSRTSHRCYVSLSGGKPFEPRTKTGETKRSNDVKRSIRFGQLRI